MVCAHNTITGILFLCGPVQFGPALHARLYLVLYYSTRIVMVQLPMYVLRLTWYILQLAPSGDDQSPDVAYYS